MTQTGTDVEVYSFSNIQTVINPFCYIYEGIWHGTSSQARQS
jgi:hypothetical protein